MEITPKINFYRQRDFGQKFNATFEFVRANFKSLAKVVFYLLGPIGLVVGIIGGTFMSQMGDMFGQSNPTQMVEMYSKLFSSPLYLSFMVISMFGGSVAALVSYAYMYVYHQNQTGSPVVFDDVLLVVKAKAARYMLGSIGLIGVMIIATIVLGLIGALLSFAPVIAGIYIFFILLAVVYALISISLFYPLYIFEERSLLKSIERCFRLISNNWWASLGYLIVLILIYSICSYLLQLPSQIVTIINMFHSLEGTSEEGVTSWVVVLTSIIGSFANFMLYPVLYIGTAFQYFNLAEQKDHVGLKSQIDQIGKAE